MGSTFACVSDTSPALPLENERILYFEDPAYKLIYDLPRVPSEGDLAVIYLDKKKIKQSVIGRYDDILKHR